MESILVPILEGYLFCWYWIGNHWLISYLSFGAIWGIQQTFFIHWEDTKRDIEREGIQVISVMIGAPSLLWGMLMWVTLVEQRPHLFFGLVGSILFYFFHKEPLFWAITPIVIIVLWITERNHKANWEPTGDDVFPYRRKGPF